MSRIKTVKCISRSFIFIKIAFILKAAILICVMSSLCSTSDIANNPLETKCQKARMNHNHFYKCIFLRTKFLNNMFRSINTMDEDTKEEKKGDVYVAKVATFKGDKQTEETITVSRQKAKAPGE